MNIFINIDDRNENANKTKEELIRICGNSNINVINSPDNADIIISIGGDGTFLKSSNLACGKNILGVNCGTLGYLTEVNPGDLIKAVEDINTDNYYIEKRMMLEGEILKENGDVIKIPPALNEIAISKNILGVIRFDVFIDEKLINSYTADGIIVSTPTGSTAYNLSCGGPISDPTAHIITLTPIAPHSIINRSIILSDESIVELKITELRENQAFVLYDGNPIEIAVGDSIKIKKSSQSTNMIKLNWRSFIDNIRENIH